jgi:UDP-4-amino-4,6-dideoxy-N-acetyl-beta-L-altrosamine transaminase
MNIIPYGRQNITDEDIKAVVDSLNSDYLTQGPKIKEFEDAFAQYIGCKYAVAVSNGTAALHLSALALGISMGNKVITVPITFAASANCIKYCGGEIVFADIDPETYLMDVNKVKVLLESAPRNTYQGLIPVDFAGRAVNLESFRKLADEHNLWIIEDACHSPGGYFVDSNDKKQNCGNGNFADLAVFSFHPVKHITTGEGGMITTNDRKLYNKLLDLRTHGITRDAGLFKNPIDFAVGETSGKHDVWPGWYMEMQTLGFNYRLTDLQASLGISQVRRAEQGVSKRKEIAKRYVKAFDKVRFIKSQLEFTDSHAYHLFVIEVENRVGLYNYLREKNIYAQVHYIPCHLMPYYRELGWKEGDMPFAENYYRNCISLPIFPTLTEQEQEYVIEVILNFYDTK